MEAEPVGELRLVGDLRRLVAQVVDPGRQSDLDARLPQPALQSLKLLPASASSASSADGCQKSSPLSA